MGCHSTTNICWNFKFAVGKLKKAYSISIIHLVFYVFVLFDSSNLILASTRFQQELYPSHFGIWY